MPVRAVFFDVGDTLVEHWAPAERLHELLREALRNEFGDREWHDRLVRARIGPEGHTGWGSPEAVERADEEALRQETLRWYADWFRNASIGIDDIDMDRLRTTMVVPLELVSTPVPGAFTAVRWCKAHDLTVVLVTNTLARGDDEVWEDWRRFGLADAIDGVVSSHSVGWQKPHRRIFERALEIAAVAPAEAVMVGDRLLEDVWGATRLGMRAVLRRTPHPQARVDVTPDAVIDDLTSLPAVLSAWRRVPGAQTGPQRSEVRGP